MTVKTVLSATGKGLANAAVAIHNSSNLVRIDEIDEQIKTLQIERDHLKARLID